MSTPTFERAPRAVIAGATGQIGRALVASLLDHGWHIDALTRDPTRARRRVPAAAGIVAWSARPDGASRAELANVLDGADAVVNLAGAPVAPWPWTSRHRRAIRESRIGSTKALVGAMAALPVDRRPSVLVNASGTDIYTGRDAEPADESTPPAHDFLGETCIRWEAAANAAEPLGVRVVTLRTAVVLARGAVWTRLVAMPFRMFLGGRMGSGDQWFSWVHIDDVVGIYRTAILDAGISGPMNVTAPEPVRGRDLARAMARVLRRPNWLPIPASVLRLTLGEESTLALGSRRAVPAVAEAAGYVFRYPDLEPALADVL